MALRVNPRSNTARRLPLLLAAAAMGSSSAVAGASPAAARLDPWPLPSGADHAAQPNLVVDAAGRVLLSWIEPHDGGHRLRFARAEDGRFGPVHDVAAGLRWFVNWADFPALQPLEDGRVAAFVLVRNGEAPYAYDVQLGWSDDDGASWSPLAVVHDDGTETEHGFASLWRWQDGLGIAWLDGRNTAVSPDGGHAGHHGHGGAMSLRAARFDGAGRKQADWPLDDSVCDCCQTAAAMTDDGPLLVYRDRADGEIRDIGVLRWQGDGWSQPALVHADGWMMPACPVNGPAVVASQRDVHVAWYTAAGGEAALKLARSDDAGASFHDPLTIDRGADLLGRIALARDGDTLWIAWLRDQPAHRAQTLWLQALDPHTLTGSPAQQVATLHGGRASGFPRAASDGSTLHLVWTDVVDGKPRLRGARLKAAPPAQ